MTSVLDSILLQNNFSTPAIRSIWSDDNKISKQLAVEAALAAGEGTNMYKCLGSGSVDCPIAHAKVKYVFGGYSLEE